MRHLPRYKSMPNITMPLRLSLCKGQFNSFPSHQLHHLRCRRRIPYHSMSSRDLLSRSSNTKRATGMSTLVETLPAVLESFMCARENMLHEIYTNSSIASRGVFRYCVANCRQGRYPVFEPWPVSRTQAYSKSTKLARVEREAISRR